MLRDQSQASRVLSQEEHYTVPEEHYHAHAHKPDLYTSVLTLYQSNKPTVSH